MQGTPLKLAHNWDFKTAKKRINEEKVRAYQGLLRWVSGMTIIATVPEIF